MRHHTLPEHRVHRTTQQPWNILPYSSHGPRFEIRDTSLDLEKGSQGHEAIGTHNTGETGILAPQGQGRKHGLNTPLGIGVGSEIGSKFAKKTSEASRFEVRDTSLDLDTFGTHSRTEYFDLTATSSPPLVEIFDLDAQDSFDEVSITDSGPDNVSEHDSVYANMYLDNDPV